MKIVLDERVDLWYNPVIKIPQVVRVEVARGAGRRQVKEPPPICLTWVDICAMLFEIVRRKHNGFTDI